MATASGINCYQIWIESNNNQWVEYSEVEWSVCVPGLLNQIWTDNEYIFVAVDFGLEIVDLFSESKIAYIPYLTGFNTVWADNEKIYLGTTNSGIKYIYKTCISGSISTPYDLSNCLLDYNSPYGISSPEIKYIHGNGNKLMCCTSSGIDIYWGDFGYRSTATISGTRKCFMTSTGKFYYTSISGNVWSLNKVSKCLWDWSQPDYTYSTGGDILASGIEINDIFVTERTAANGIDDTIFLATSSGAYIIDSGSNNYNIYYKE